MTGGAAQRWFDATNRILSSANSIKRKKDVFDLPSIAKKLKTFHFPEADAELTSISLDNIITISTGTNSASSVTNSNFGSKEPPSPDIY